MVAISKADRIKLDRLASKVTETVRHDFKFAHVSRAGQNFALSYEKEYDKKLFETGTVSTAKDMIGFAFLTAMSAQYYYWNMPVAKIMMRHKSVIDLVENLNSNYDGSRVLSISNLSDTWMYKATPEELPVLILVANKFVEGPNKPSPFHAP